MTTALVAAVTDSLIRRRSPSPRSSSKHRRDTPSPSPPPAGEELQVFFDDCVSKVRVPQDAMNRAFRILDEEGYTPAALGHRDLDQDKIARLTGLRDGAVMSIHALAEEWCENHHGKKRSISRR